MTDIPGRSRAASAWPSSMAILMGKRCTTLVKLPVALSALSTPTPPERPTVLVELGARSDLRDHVRTLEGARAGDDRGQEYNVT